MICPMGMHTPNIPTTVPRCAGGTRSGMIATIAASTALNDNWAAHHPNSTTLTVGASPITARDAHPHSTPPTSQGLRRPKRERVLSLSAPKTGLLTSATIAPAMSTREMGSAALSGASCRTRSASVMIAGVSRASHSAA